METETAPADQRFQHLFDSHFAAVLAYARRRTTHVEDAEDVAAEAFTVAWRRLDAIPASGQLPWLYGVARRVLANQRRGQRRMIGLLDRIRQHTRDVPTATSGQASPILDAMARLKPADQEVLRLSAWEDLGAQEIAAVLGVSTNAATIRLHRARKRLRAALEPLASDQGKNQAAAGQSSQ